MEVDIKEKTRKTKKPIMMMPKMPKQENIIVVRKKQTIEIEPELKDNFKGMIRKVMTIPHPKKAEFENDLERSKFMNEYISKNALLDILDNANDNLKFTMIYTYLFFKNL